MTRSRIWLLAATRPYCRRSSRPLLGSDASAAAKTGFVWSSTVAQWPGRVWGTSTCMCWPGVRWRGRPGRAVFGDLTPGAGLCYRWCSSPHGL